MSVELIVAILISYLVGSLPFGYWIARLLGKDITQEGSKNIGATNVARVLGRGPGLLVFVLDVLKGFLPALIGGQILLEQHTYLIASVVLGTSAVMGHMCSVWLKFKGGKGVATALGVLIAVTPYVALIALGMFIVCFAVCRWVSLSSIVAALTVPVSSLLLNCPNWLVVVYMGLSVFIIFKHRANIIRILHKTEPKFRV